LVRGGSWVYFLGVSNICGIYIKKFQKKYNIVNWCGGTIAWLYIRDAGSNPNRTTLSNIKRGCEGDQTCDL